MHGAVNGWQKLYQQIYQHLKPGGWFEHIQPDIELRCNNHGCVKENDTFNQWAQLFYDADDKLSGTFRVIDGTMQNSAQEAGFVDITHEVFTIPHSPWPKEKFLEKQGQFVGLYMDLSLDGFALYPVGQILGWSFEEGQVLVAKMRAAIRNPKNLTNSMMSKSI